MLSFRRRYLNAGAVSCEMLGTCALQFTAVALIDIDVVWT